MTSPRQQSSPSDEDRWFGPTHWSVVLEAGQIGSPKCLPAREDLCRAYWQPLYCFIRRRGYGIEEAQDLTQAFLAHLLEKNPFAKLHPRKGKFRSFLLAAVQNYLADDRDRAKAVKRGGGLKFLSFEQDGAEAAVAESLSTDVSAEVTFDRQWAMGLLDVVLRRLANEAAAKGEAKQFQQLQAFLCGDAEAAPYAEVAARLRTTPGAVSTAVSRLRARYRKLIRDEVAKTVSSPSAVDEEVRYLRAVLSR